MAKDKTENNTVTIEFLKSKETKGTVVFGELRNDDDRPHTFYMLKGLYAQLGSPNQIVMTIEVN